jgi:hypothetical protein
MKLKKKIFSLIACGSLMLSMVTPAFAQSVVISGNGADSKSETKVNVGSSTNVTQSNTAFVTNTVTTSSTTGDNQANKNTSGNVTVTTGDTATQVTVANTLNSNAADVNCCGDTAVSTLISGNGADSNNKVDVNDGKSGISISQANMAVVNNKVTDKSVTGENDANKNTSGNVTITTGDTLTKVNVTTEANSNTAVVGSAGTTGVVGGASVIISDNGADSKNDVKLGLGKDTNVYQGNSAWVVNNVKTESETGDNTANRNTSGNVLVDTGVSVTLTDVTNKLNQNVAAVDCCGTGDVLVKIVGNGADSKNDIKLDMGGSTNVVQGFENRSLTPYIFDGLDAPVFMPEGGNMAQLTNSILSDNDTGDNKAGKNTGGTVSIYTGDTGTEIDVLNKLNFNYADIGCCDNSLLAKIDSNGADTNNKLDLKLGGEKGAWQANSALLANIADPNGSTGDNKADGNNGGTLGNDPMVVTGDSTNVVDLSNVGNQNELGGSMPQVEFSFQLSFDWAHSWLPFLWN